MKRLVAFPLDQGGSVLIEVGEPPAGPAMCDPGEDRSAVAEQAGRTFEDAAAAVIPAVRCLAARLRLTGGPADEAGAGFGVPRSAQTGALIASVAAGADFGVPVIWRGRAAGT